MGKHVLNKLSVRKVETAEPGRYWDGGGLSLNVRDGGSKAWELRFRLHGKDSVMGLGSAADVTLAEAREKAVEYRKLVAQGKDPRDARTEQLRAAIKSKTFRDYAEEYVIDKSPGWSGRRTQERVEQRLRDYIYPTKIVGKVTFGDLPIEKVDTRAVRAVLQPIWATKNPTAQMVRLLMEAVIDFASAIDNLPLDNPARWRGRLKRILAAPSEVHQTEHRPSLPYAKAPAYVAIVRQHSCIGAAALEFVIHAPVRVEVAVSAEWPEFHPKEMPDGSVEFPDRTWSIPQAKMKMRKKVRYPDGIFMLALTDPMIEILKRMWLLRRHNYVFPGRGRGRHITADAVLTLNHRFTDDAITTHGFRATTTTWADDRTICEDWVKKMLLGHSVGTQTEKAYRRSDLIAKRGILQEAWSRYLTTGEDLVYDIGAIFKERHNAQYSLLQAAE